MKRWKIAFCLPAVVFVIATSYNMVRYRYNFINATIRSILMESTQWAEGFSDWSFAKIRIGMTEKEVFSFIGEPLNRGTNKHAAVWTYFLAEPDKHNCNGKKIYFDQKWIVNKIESGFKTIHIGMHKNEVVTRIGEAKCYTQFDDSYEYTWSYSNRGEINGNYDRRWVSFDRSGKAINIVHTYYVD